MHLSSATILGLRALEGGCPWMDQLILVLPVMTHEDPNHVLRIHLDFDRKAPVTDQLT